MADDLGNQVPKQYVEESVRTALAEDVGAGDLTADLVPEDRQAHAVVIARQAAVVCGQAWFDEVFRQLDESITVDWRKNDGDSISANEIICEVHGPARAVLTGERTALNFLQLLASTATMAKAFVDAVAGTDAVILDTRKTLPGLRLAQKYAVTVGGARNHRIGLYDGILIKENHIAAAGSIGAAVSAAGKQANVLVEVEVETLEQMKAALTSGASRLLLDNFSVSQLLEAVTLRDKLAPDIELEASGGIHLGNIAEIANTGVNYISIGSLTKDVQATDLSMQIRSVEKNGA